MGAPSLRRVLSPQDFMDQCLVGRHSQYLLASVQPREERRRVYTEQ